MDEGLTLIVHLPLRNLLHFLMSEGSDHVSFVVGQLIQLLNRVADTGVLSADRLDEGD